MVLELDIQVEELVEVHVCMFPTRMHDVRIEMARIQLELNLQITEL